MRRAIEEVAGLECFTAKCHPDQRGFLLQSYVRSDLEARGIPGDFRQAIQSMSKRGTVRGLHFQWEPPQGKLIRCVTGAIFDVAVDIRPGSPTLGDHVVVEMSGRNGLVFWLPPGFAHGFMALEDESIVLYECTAEWSQSGEGGILWNDAALGIDWPRIPPLVSVKDRRNPTLERWLADPRSRAFALSADRANSPGNQDTKTPGQIK
jgi:dTDP-4-dehydrorhamnose 3,5-epimerase